MNKGDIIWAGILSVVVLFLIFKPGREIYINFVSRAPYLSGFIKYMILSSMGELLSLRLENKYWSKSKGFFIKSVIWGIIGILITFMFRFYYNGVKTLQSANLLAGSSSYFLSAFFTSVIMNFTFGITFILCHRISDAIIDYRIDNSCFNNVAVMIGTVNWPRHLSYIIKMIVFFWIPVHTIVFMFPEVYRVLFSAFLSIVLGVLLRRGGR